MNIRWYQLSQNSSQMLLWLRKKVDQILGFVPTSPHADSKKFLTSAWESCISNNIFLGINQLSKNWIKRVYIHVDG